MENHLYNTLVIEEKMKKIVFYICILLLFNLISCNQNDDEIKYNEALKKIGNSDLEGAKNILFHLIENSKNAIALHEYYFTLDSVLKIETNKISNKLNDKINSDKAPINHGKYTVSLVWGSKEIHPSIKPLIDRRIEILEEYLKKFERGKYRFYFLNELLFLFNKNDVEKVKRTAELLSASKSKEDKFYSYLFLGSIYHEEKNYDKAINYYDKIISLETDSVKTGAYLLYKADCYYKMDEYDKAITSLERIIILEYKLEKPVVSIIAGQWIKVITNSKNNFKSSKETLVYFN
jgi:tetratricopeptide (TPR) repeat protein